MLRLLRDGKLHLALMVKVPIMPMAGLRFDEIERHAVCVAMHPGHPLARKRTVGLRDIAPERLIAFTLSEYPEYHAWLAGLFEGLKKSPHVSEEHDSVTSLIAAVESGRGIALVSERLECMAGPRLKIVPLKPAPPPLVIGVARAETQTSQAVEAFVEGAKQKG